MPDRDNTQEVSLIDRSGERGRIISRGETKDGTECVLVERDDRSNILVPVSVLKAAPDSSNLRIDDDFDAHQPADGNITSGTLQSTIPIVEEELVVSTNEVETGRVRVRTRVDERSEHIDIPVERQRVDVERRPVNQVVEKPVEPWYDGNTLVIPVLEERVVLRKELVVTEEVRITRLAETERHQEEITLRAERAEIDRIEP